MVSQCTALQEGVPLTLMGRKTGPAPRHISQEGESRMERDAQVTDVIDLSNQLGVGMKERGEP